MHWWFIWITVIYAIDVWIDVCGICDECDICDGCDKYVMHVWMDVRYM